MIRFILLSIVIFLALKLLRKDKMSWKETIIGMAVLSVIFIVFEMYVFA
ncbi:heme/copper-type cytochrome/quinol oxidase subunit 4 [Alkalicoccobacillus murimartini]|uniref:Heme/copper-type cytochrome/quinol oxidase subunit 4 n=1 Tax=Alkalicoccobacillus murimartini TaxID=171685 RepID=A0ABT9YP06_9BACI|nr:heme/copper-type cytochrome/quinol oxidase subunit 4 [Alkalicoccobacillus murimartini]